MEKIIKTTKDIEETHHYCDCCGKEIQMGYGAIERHSCKMCDNIMCDDCRKNYPIENEVTRWYEAYDETPYICKDCDDIIKPFAERLNDLWEEYLKKKDKIIKEFQSKRKQKGN